MPRNKNTAPLTLNTVRFTKIFRKSIQNLFENLLKFYRNSIKILSKLYRTSIEILSEFYWFFIEGPLGRAHRRPSIYALHTVSDRRREACNLKPEIAWGRNRDGHVVQGIVPKWCWFAYMLCYRDMCCPSFRFWSTECGEHFCTKWGQMRCKKLEISLRSHAIKQTMLNVACQKGL